MAPVQQQKLKSTDRSCHKKKPFSLKVFHFHDVLKAMKGKPILFFFSL